MARSHRGTLLIALLAVGIAPAFAVSIVSWLLLRVATDVGRALPVLLVFDGLMVLAAAAFAWRMATALAFPIDRLRDGASLIAGPNPGHRIAGETGGLAEIAQSLNTLADRVQAVQPGMDAPLTSATSSSEDDGPVAARPDQGEDSRSTSPSPESIPLRRRALRDVSYAVVDLETTGLDPRSGARVVSIASVRVCDGVVDHQDRFSTLVDPGQPIPAASTRIHGIDDAMVRGMPSLDRALGPLVAHVGDSVLVGHSIAFDLAFLEPALRAAGLPSLRRHGVLDTQLLGSLLLPSYRPTTLEDLAALLGVEVAGRHTALGDASTTAEAFSRLIVLLEQRGIERLGEVLDLPHRSALARLLHSRPRPH